MFRGAAIALALPTLDQLLAPLAPPSSHCGLGIAAAAGILTVVYGTLKRGSVIESGA